MLTLIAENFAVRSKLPDAARPLGGAGKPIFFSPIRTKPAMRPQLRLYTGENESSSAVAEPEVSMTLGEISEILADAVRTQRAWLRDFENDRLQVSADLYDVLAAYWNMRRGA
jgi:hypothetical protein